MTRAVSLGIALLAVAVGTAGAQSLPPITAPKRAAQNAVNATNTHTTTVTADPSATKDTAPTAARPEGVAATPVRRAAAVRDSAAGTPATARRAPGDSAAALFRRETFYYERGGRRDPFTSLMTSGELRPLISDVRLVGVVLSSEERASVAVLRDLVTKDQYRVRVGQTLGRMRVARIEAKRIVFTIEEFGFSRQEALSLDDSNSARNE